MNTSTLRTDLSKRLRAMGIEEQAWPGRTDGFASLTFRGKDLGHFHSDHEIDVRLGKELKKQERLVPLPDSTVHPGRAQGSPWHEMRIASAAYVDEIIRLVGMAIGAMKAK